MAIFMISMDKQKWRLVVDSPEGGPSCCLSLAAHALSDTPYSNVGGICDLLKPREHGKDDEMLHL